MSKDVPDNPIGGPSPPDDDATAAEQGKYFQALDVPWAGRLIRTSEGVPKPIIYNAIVAIEGDRSFNDQYGKSFLRFDAFRGRGRVSGPLPWDGISQFPRDWTDQDDRECNNWLQDSGIFTNLLITASAVQTVFERNKFHPVMDYLSAQIWDGEPRLGKWLATYLGVEETPYTSAVGAKWLISAVARIMDPGCKADCVLILEGPQGKGKSTALDILGGDWYTADVAAIGSGTTAQEQILGKWIIELDELDAITRASDVAAVKAFISRRIDNFRLPYAHRSQSHPRQCVFAATTNRDNWNRDETGGRRYWPVRVGDLDLAALRDDRDQLWAEARDQYSLGELWWLEETDIIEQAKLEQAARFEPDPWEDAVVAVIKDLRPTPGNGINLNDILVQLGLMIDRRGKPESGRVSSILRHLGFRREHRDIDGSGRCVWRYFKE